MELLAENSLAYDVYLRCWHQVIVSGMGDIVGLNLPAIYLLMESYGIPKDEKLSFLDKLITLHEAYNPPSSKKDSKQAMKDAMKEAAREMSQERAS